MVTTFGLREQMDKISIIDHVGLKAGMDYYSSSLARGFKEIGISPFLFSNIDGLDGIETESIFRKEKGSFLSNVSNAILPWRKAAHLCRQNGIQDAVIHIFSFERKDELSMRILKAAGINIHAIVHDVEHLGNKEHSGKRQQYILSQCDFIYVHNDFSAKALAGRGFDRTIKIPMGNYHYLPSKLTKEDARKKLSWSTDESYVLFFGQIKPVKGLEVMLRALQGLSCKLVIAGKPWHDDFSHYDDMIGELNLSSKIEKHIRFIEDEERDLFFKASDLLVLPYEKIFQSAVMQMAFSYKLPIISSDLLPFRDMLQNDSLGEMFETGNSEALHQALKSFLVNPKKAQQKADKAYKYAEDNLHWKGIAENFKY